MQGDGLTGSWGLSFEKESTRSFLDRDETLMTKDSLPLALFERCFIFKVQVWLQLQVTATMLIKIKYNYSIVQSKCNILNAYKQQVIGDQSTGQCRQKMFPLSKKVPLERAWHVFMWEIIAIRESTLVENDEGI